MRQMFVVLLVSLMILVVSCEGPLVGKATGDVCSTDADCSGICESGSCIDLCWETASLAPTSNILSLAFVNENEGWAGARDALYRTEDSGITWQEQDFSADSASFFVYIAPVPGTNSVYVARGDDIFYSPYKGSSWTLKKSLDLSYQNYAINGLHFFDNNNGIAYGQVIQSTARWPTILRTSNGGATWTEKGNGAMRSFNDHHFISSTTGWVVGGLTLTDLPHIMKTTDGGNTWDSINLGINANRELNVVYFVDEMNGWVAGGILAKTSDGGATWQSVGLPPTPGVIRDIYMFTDQHVLLGANNGLFETYDGGSSWSLVSSGSTNVLNFISKDMGWAVQGADINKLLECNTCGDSILDGSCSVLIDGDSVADCLESEGEWSGETCDDGNKVDGDGCSMACQVEVVCGDGVCNALYEDVESCVADCEVLGCTDIEAYNYDSTANQDDGSCLTCGDGECSEDMETTYTCSDDCGLPPVYGDTDNDGDADLDDAKAIARSLLGISTLGNWVGCNEAPSLRDAIGIINQDSPYGLIFEGCEQ
jgi:cysteine-rich repeat protein